MTFCRYCGQDIDEETCHCGDGRSAHPYGVGHNFVPIGCICGYMKGSRMSIKVRWKKLGGHIHCDVFTAKAPNMTYANCGGLVFDEREWPTIRNLLFGNTILEEKP